MLRPRVGHIQFINCLPLYYGLVYNNVLLDIDLVKGTPTELNKLLLEGKLDISPISSIEYCRNYKDLILLPNLAVAADGEVQSILFVSKVPVEKLDGHTIALTNTSATSQALLRIILRDKYKISPRYFVCPPDLAKMLMEADGALLIGDDALRVLYNPPTNLHIYDLGREWKELTGRRMVFAVWAARRIFAAENPDLVKEVYYAFMKSMQYSIEKVDEIAQAASRWEVFDACFMKDYFMSLRFDLDSFYQEDLLAYATRAYELGFIPEIPWLDFVEVQQASVIK
ncbi:MAG: menaquinone biosynthesis protein [Actinomycetota bacterium]|nr:menaquinone biosynthesis protein [Actinomycetota bacterium]